MAKKNSGIIWIAAIAVAAVLIYAGIAINQKLKDAKISSFQSCVDAGYPVGESYPLQCRTSDGRTFSEKISLEEAIEIALKSVCAEQGELTNDSFENENSLTWWIDIEMKPEFEKEGCNPACVVSEVTKTAEINWRCTGLIPP